MKTAILSLFTAITLFGCNMTDQRHYYVSPPLGYYVTKFFNEGASRGFKLDDDDLLVQLAPAIDKYGVVGITFHKTIPEIYIDEEFFNQHKTDTLLIETIVFHELGHAIMHREHCNTYSLMNPNKYVSDYRQDPAKREMLLDELLEFKQ